ncbi:hypothetical protein A5780_00575 [Nocardia sp. 852002-20019_SCH5090214]|uniref:hypothetical protein n=1 Tax=Nocardia TaxID=1817 RepID=UPI000801BF65|nr:MULTISPECIES: hypothetical protein [Nocardia]OBA63802.1 hypothetical protein A5780_00575 [Nocardia sp. 852002-20019_SCH5090214]
MPVAWEPFALMGRINYWVLFRSEGPMMATGKKAASEAGKELGNKKSTKAEKSVAASDLAQAKKGKGKKS